MASRLVMVYFLFKEISKYKALGLIFGGAKNRGLFLVSILGGLTTLV